MQNTSQTYSIVGVGGATSYIWTIPAGWVGTSTTTSISANIGAATGNVTVKASNGCGASAAQTKAVTPWAVTAVTISGNPQNFNFCAQNTPTSVIMTASSGYNSYAWTPSGGNAVSATVNAVNTYTVTATDAHSCTTHATIAVTNNCALPTGLSTTNILGTSAVANWTQSQCRVNYTIRIAPHGTNTWTTHTIAPANTYTFTGLTIGHQYDWQIETLCNTGGSINSGWTTVQTFTTAASRVEQEATVAALPFNVYPNPASNQVTIDFSTMEEGAYNVMLFDMFGRMVRTETGSAANGDNQHLMNLTGIPAGMYMITLQKGDVILKAKLIVE